MKNETMNEQMKANFEQVTEQLNGLNATWLETTRASMDAWTGWRESWSQMAADVAKRNTDISKREQNLALDVFEGARSEMEKSWDRASKSMKSMTEASQSWSREAGKALQAQTDVMQNNMGEWMAVASPMATNGSSAKSNGTKTTSTKVKSTN